MLFYNLVSLKKNYLYSTMKKNLFIITILLYTYSYTLAQEVPMVQYDNETIGWSIQFPESWDVTVLDQVVDEATAGVKGMVYPLFFQKDQFNSLQSTLVPSEYKTYEDWKAQTSDQNAALMETLLSQGVKAESKAGSSKIGEIDFEYLDVVILNPEGVVILKQRYYATLIKGYELGITISYNDGATMQVLNNAIDSCKFD